MSPPTNNEWQAKRHILRENAGVIYALINIADSIDAQTQVLRDLKDEVKYLADHTARTK